MTKGDPTTTAAIIASYVSRNPTPHNTPELVKQIAEEHQLSEASVRSRLMYHGHYLHKPKDKLSTDDKRWALEMIGPIRLNAQNRPEFVKTIVAYSRVKEDVVERWLKEQRTGVAKSIPASSVPVETEAMKEANARVVEAKARLAEANVRVAASEARVARSRQFTFEEKLNGRAGWFQNPLWILNTVVCIFLVGLVFTAIASIFE